MKRLRREGRRAVPKVPLCTSTSQLALSRSYADAPGQPIAGPLFPRGGDHGLALGDTGAQAQRPGQHQLGVGRPPGHGDGGNLGRASDSRRSQGRYGSSPARWSRAGGCWRSWPVAAPRPGPRPPGDAAQGRRPSASTQSSGSGSASSPSSHPAATDSAPVSASRAPPAHRPAWRRRPAPALSHPSRQAVCGRRQRQCPVPARPRQSRRRQVHAPADPEIELHGRSPVVDRVPACRGVMRLSARRVAADAMPPPARRHGASVRPSPRGPAASGWS